MVNPEKVKYYLDSQSRRRITKRIDGKGWRKSHLVYAWYHHLTLETMQLLLDLGYIVHHINGNLQDDTVDNLQLITVRSHCLIHHYRNDISDKQIINLIIKKRLSANKTAEILKVNYSTVCDRLHKMGYKNFGFWGGKSHWTEEDINANDHPYNIDKQITDLVIKQGLSYRKTAKLLNISKGTLGNRIYKMGYKNISKGRKALWIKED